MSKENKETTSKSIESKEKTRKIDVTRLVSIIPPASQLKRREAKIKEKRIRIRYNESLPLGVVKISKKLAEMLNIKNGDLVDIVVAGRHKFVYKAVIEEGEGVNEVYCNPEELKERGVADNSIATIRRHS